MKAGNPTITTTKKIVSQAFIISEVESMESTFTEIQVLIENLRYASSNALIIELKKSFLLIIVTIVFTLVLLLTFLIAYKANLFASRRRRSSNIITHASPIKARKSKPRF